MNRRNILKAFGAAGTGMLAGGGPLTAAQETAGLGIDIDEKVAAKFPYRTPGGSRGNDRRLDGTIVRP